MRRPLVTLAQAVEARPWLTKRYARRLIAERRVAHHKVGGRVLLDLNDLDEFAERSRVEAVDRRPLRVVTRARELP